MMHIFSMKDKTKSKGIKVLTDPKFFYLSLLQSIGSKSIPVVSVGDEIHRYQLVAKASSAVSSNIHSPVSGKIVSISEHPLADGTMVDTIVIENDFKYTELDIQGHDIEKLDSEQIFQIIRDAGIVGLGGAQFPTHTKYDIKEQNIETFIVNGAECEPYLTSDYALMKDKTGRLFYGISIVNKILKAKAIVIGIEEQNKDLLAVFNSFLEKSEYKNIQIKILSNQYPQGGELQLIKSVTGRVVPRDGRSKDYGVIVSNAGTVEAVYDAVVMGKPLVERVITVSGEKSKGFGNYKIKIGTTLAHVMKELAIDLDEGTHQPVLGGPMMGKNVIDFSAPFLKGSSGLLFLEKQKIKRNNCISCGYCVDVCPMHLMPMKFEEYYRRNKIAKLEAYNLNLCIECSACEYICPSNVPLIESIVNGKRKLKSLLTHAN